MEDEVAGNGAPASPFFCHNHPVRSPALSRSRIWPISLVLPPSQSWCHGRPGYAGLARVMGAPLPNEETCVRPLINDGRAQTIGPAAIIGAVEDGGSLWHDEPAARAEF